MRPRDALPTLEENSQGGLFYELHNLKHKSLILLHSNSIYHFTILFWQWRFLTISKTIVLMYLVYLLPIIQTISMASKIKPLYFFVIPFSSRIDTFSPTICEEDKGSNFFFLCYVIKVVTSKDYMYQYFNMWGSN